MNRSGQRDRHGRGLGADPGRSMGTAGREGTGRMLRGIVYTMVCAISCGICLTACANRETGEQVWETLAKEETPDINETDTSNEAGAANGTDTSNEAGAANGTDAINEAGATKENQGEMGDGTRDAGGEASPNAKQQTQMQENEEIFVHLAQEAGLEPGEWESCFQRLCQDDIFAGGDLELVDFILEDLDENGQEDMVVMVQNPDALFVYGTGCVYFYMNEDAPYCFLDEEFPFFFQVDLSSGDLDGDGNVEIVFGAQGTGNGGAGDWHYRLLTYKDHTMEWMELPSDSYETEERGIRIQVIQETKKDTYSAYCPVLEETLTFTSQNAKKPEKQAMEVGGNCRGFYQVECVEYEGRYALKAAEYLFGEGGIVHGVGAAWFVFVWDGEWRIAKWWVEPW